MLNELSILTSCHGHLSSFPCCFSAHSAFGYTSVLIAAMFISAEEEEEEGGLQSTTEPG
jgi:hypothetical protein